MTTFRGVTHAPSPDGLLAEVSLCGADPATNYGGVLRMQSEGYTCLVCIDMASQPVETPLEPCVGQPFADWNEAVGAAADAGFVTWRQFSCTDGHTHVADGQF